MNKRIYIVEDEAIIALEIKRSIIKLGYIFAGQASNYDDALQGIQRTKPDLILIDIMLRGSKSGIEIAKALTDHQSTPIIFLTSVTDEQTMQEAILTAPASYLLKPFRREELHSAILLGLHKASLQSVLNIETIEIKKGYHYQPSENLLFYNNDPVQLAPKERRLLECLIRAKGKVVTFKILEETVWQGEAVSSSALRTLLYRLHKKLGTKLIETIPTFGCRMKLSNT